MKLWIGTMLFGLCMLIGGPGLAEEYTVVHDLFTAATTEEAIWEALPEETASEQDMLNAGGICDFLKTVDRRTCLFKVRDAQIVRLLVYDADTAGRYRRTGDICIPTWYNEAAIATADLLADGRKALLIEHYGNVGTGTQQRILAMLAWHPAEAGAEGAFRLIFWETVFYQLGFVGDERRLGVTYEFVPASSPSEIRLNYHYNTLRDDAPFFAVTWEDRLVWNAEQFRFEDSALSAKLDSYHWYAGACVQQNIYTTRRQRADLTSLDPFCDADDKMLALHDPYAPCWSTADISTEPIQ